MRLESNAVYSTFGAGKARFDISVKNQRELIRKPLSTIGLHKQTFLSPPRPHLGVSDTMDPSVDSLLRD